MVVPEAAVTVRAVGLGLRLVGETSVSFMASISPLIGPHSARTAARFLSGCVVVLKSFSSVHQAQRSITSSALFSTSASCEAVGWP